MKINDLIKLAAKAYPDRFVTEYWDFKKSCFDESGSGDTLAKFIAIELSETFGPKENSKNQLIEAIRVMDRAKENIGDVSFALEQKLDKLYRKKGNK